MIHCTRSWKRVGAAIIDGVVTMAGGLAISFVFGMVMFKSRLNSTMKLQQLLILSLVFALSCRSPEADSPFAGLPVHTPAIIHQFDALGDDYYFSHLAYTSVVLDDGTIFLADRQAEIIFKASADGELISVIASEGRGPGEIRDITFVSRSYDRSILVYDQRNRKVLRFSPIGDFLDEFIMPARERGSLSAVYEPDEHHLLTVFHSLEYLANPDSGPAAWLVIFDKISERYTLSTAISDRVYARHIVDNQFRGGRKVPFAPENFRYFAHNNAGFYVFWSEAPSIVSLSAELDTTRTITFDLEREPLSRKEINAIRDDVSDNMWREMQPLLPDHKALADDFRIDKQNHFWLRLNHKSEFQQWLILSESGKKLAVVQFPKEGILTHISNQHIGFRLNNHLFALFEPIVL